MSITRGIEIHTKNNDIIDCDDRCASWKNILFDIWVSDYLFDKCNIEFAHDLGDGYICKIPKEILWQMAEDLEQGRFEIFPGYCSSFGFDEAEKRYAKTYAEKFKQMVNEIFDDEFFVYYDFGY